MTQEQVIESLRFSLETKKLRMTELEMENSRMKKESGDKDKIIEGYQRFIRDNLHNVKTES
tara:strand:- start:716 stop:898 length:183 start_codon:yes stop_codon:yes gene_type:complete